MRESETGDGLAGSELRHAIRGAAAQLGATALAGLCSRSDLSSVQLSAAIDALEAALPQPGAGQEKTSARLSPAAFARCLKALEGREMRGFDLLLELMPSLPETAKPTLHSAAERLDFRAALQLLAASQAG